MDFQVAYPNEYEIQQRVIAAICRVYRHDRDLLKVEVNERTITHKLAEYLQDEFPEWHVDCEYNRWHDQIKRLPIDYTGEVRQDDTEARTVFPDIIVHRRFTDYNLLVIEVKKTGGSEDIYDIGKLRAFTQDPLYRYRLGLFLRIGSVVNDLELRVLKGGQEDAPWTQDLQRVLWELS
jgi:hypothetical protein